jgi:hypothetical protein
MCSSRSNHSRNYLAGRKRYGHAPVYPLYPLYPVRTPCGTMTNAWCGTMCVLHDDTQEGPDGAEVEQPIKLCLFAFDLLYLNGQ